LSSSSPSQPSSSTAAAEDFSIRLVLGSAAGTRSPRPRHADLFPAHSLVTSRQAKFMTIFYNVWLMTKVWQPQFWYKPNACPHLSHFFSKILKYHDNGQFSKIVKDAIHEDGNSKTLFQLVKTFYHIA
jgi:hypothetical protein